MLKKIDEQIGNFCGSTPIPMRYAAWKESFDARTA
jgi:hypothetical protein